MPKNKNASLRYRIINSLLKGGRKFEWQNFIQMVGELLIEEANITGNNISSRTIEYDINTMRKDKPAGFGAPIIRSKGQIYYSDSAYDMFGSNLSDETLEKLANLFTLYQSYWAFPFTTDVEKFISKHYNKHKEENHYGQFLEFDLIRNSSGILKLNECIQLLQSKKKAIIHYKTFTGNNIEMLVDPLFIKEYNNRWYLIIYFDETNQNFNLPLDRIQTLQRLNVVANTEKREGIKNTYQNCIGASIPDIESNIPEFVKLKVTSFYANFLRTKPLHQSQKEEINEESSIFTYRLYQSVELKREILRMGYDCEVLEPNDLRKEIMKEITLIYNNYIE